MEMQLLATYGLLAHEKQPVFSVERTSEKNGVQARVKVDIPYPVYEGFYGDTCVEIDGESYVLNDALTNTGSGPAMVIPVDNHGVKVRKLKVLGWEW